MRDFSSEETGVSSMSALVEASGLLRGLAEPGSAGEHVKTAMRRAWRGVPQWHWSRVRDVWYGDQRVKISADELSALRKAAASRRAREATNEAKSEFQLLQSRIARLEQMLWIQDEDFHSPQMAPLQRAAGKADRTVD